MTNYFTEVEADFYRYLTGEGGVNAHSRQNYMSWLKFLAVSYDLPADLSDEGICEILKAEDVARKEREKYTKRRDMVNFGSALRKYRDFLKSDFRLKQEETVLAEIKKVEEDETLPKTERTSITRSRIGQGIFRDRLISYWKGCSVTAFPLLDVLVASHIKPWRDSDNHQRLDVYNGLLLQPNYDKLFDKGYISFDDQGRILFSTYFPKSDRTLLGLDEFVHLLKVDPGHRTYLRYHRENCLMA